MAFSRWKCLIMTFCLIRCLGSQMPLPLIGRSKAFSWSKGSSLLMVSRRQNANSRRSGGILLTAISCGLCSRGMAVAIISSIWTSPKQLPNLWLWLRSRWTNVFTKVVCGCQNILHAIFLYIIIVCIYKNRPKFLLRSFENKRGCLL